MEKHRRKVEVEAKKEMVRGGELFCPFHQEKTQSIFDKRGKEALALRLW